MDITWILKEEIPEQGSSNDFWYDLISGGYIKPKDILVDKKQLKKYKMQ